MARHEADREDLMAEATALSPRLELAVPEEPEPVVAGFRGARLSLYFGGDPVYHFDEARRLRRAFVGGQLYRTQGQTLARLTRVRTTATTDLVRRDLSPDELAGFLADMRQRVGQLADVLSTERYDVLREVPPSSNAVKRLGSELERLMADDLHLAPAIRGRR